jgi:hypothetical protein
MSKNSPHFLTNDENLSEKFILRHQDIIGINRRKALMPQPPRRDIPSVLPLGARS